MQEVRLFFSSVSTKSIGWRQPRDRPLYLTRSHHLRDLTKYHFKDPPPRVLFEIAPLPPLFPPSASTPVRPLRLRVAVLHLPRAPPCPPRNQPPPPPPLLLPSSAAATLLQEVSVLIFWRPAVGGAAREVDGALPASTSRRWSRTRKYIKNGHSRHISLI
ncbi:hypothetical protein ABZP36_029488 [Zizania latifolia]